MSKTPKKPEEQKDQPFDFWKECTECRRNIINNYFNPFWKEYKQIPNTLADFKMKYIVNDYSPETRVAVLGVLTFGAALVSHKRLGRLRILRTIRNTVVSYYGFGLIVAPEIYNKKFFIK